MKVLLCESTDAPLTAVADLLVQVPDIDVVGVARTGRDAIDAMNSLELDMSIHSSLTVELPVLIRPALRGTAGKTVKRVVASDSPTAPLIVRAHQFGFDGIVPVTDSPEDLSAAMLDILVGRAQLADHPVVRRLGLTPGMLDKRLDMRDQGQIDLAGLLRVGLGDDEIAEVLDLPKQTVRNRIAEMIHSNGLATRTQLAVMVAVNVHIPDFSQE